MDIKLESEDANFAFPEVQTRTSATQGATAIVGETKVATRNSTTTNGITPRNGGGNNPVGQVVGVTKPRPTMGIYGKRPPPVHQGPITLTSQLSMCLRCDRHYAIVIFLLSIYHTCVFILITSFSSSYVRQLSKI